MADAQYFSNGEDYERCMGRWTRAVGTRFLDWLAAPQGAKWLDVGCGTGVFTELVDETCSPAALSAVDPSEPQVGIARNKPVRERAAFRVADAQALPYADRAFDVVVSALVINFIPDRARALAEMRRVCRKGGVIAGYVWDLSGEGSPASPIRAGLMSVGAEPSPTPGTDASRVDALASLFAAAGLTEIETTSIHVTMTFESFEEFWRSQTPAYSRMGQMLATLSKDEREKVATAVRARLQRRREDGFACSARANAVKGRVPA